LCTIRVTHTVCGTRKCNRPGETATRDLVTHILITKYYCVYAIKQHERGKDKALFENIKNSYKVLVGRNERNRNLEI
jgi:hypothetical protein